IFAQGFVPQASAAQGHPTQEHTAQEHPAQEHPAQGHTAQEHPTQEHTAQGQGTAWEAMQAMLEGMYKNPATLLEQQQAYMQHIADLLAVFPGANPLLSLQENASDAPSHAPSKPHMATPDKRFKNQQWETNPYFALVKQVYQANCAAVMESINARSKDLSPLQKRQVAFQTEQFLNAISPTNYPLTNPEVLQAAIETKGESLLRGMRALLNDLAANDGKLQIRMAKEDTFVLGKDIACTMGAVVHRTPLFELIEYAPQTPVVDATPLLIIPPWINKYYVLDLEPENSMLRWIVDQGVRLFTVSWVNPDATMRETDFEDYMTQGVLESLTVVESLTQATATHLLGYCIGGTLCSVTAAWLAAKGQQQRLRSLTLLTTLVDFHNAGDLSVFVDDQQVTALETKMNQVGYMDGRDMATTFQLLRANDLLWSFYINQYLLGKERGSMALLQWNGDPTRLPAKMHSFYLRNMYLHNLLKQPGGITIAGVPIDLEKVEVPQYLLATAADHIAPWRNCFRATQLFGGESTFVLAGSGHIAGVVNHPRKGKYGYKATTEGIIAQGSADSDFLDQATEHQGSWWPHWVDWMRKVAPEQIPASTTCGSSAYPVLDVAPGRYVLVRTD
nr:class I poly(R)-hydroxyalkanoic acid synthase [Alphaproteobacteria bacterium]